MCVNFEPEVIVIPSGAFLMGCREGAENEGPVHRVWVDRFALGRWAVTNRLYRIFQEETGRTMPRGFNDTRFNHPDQPVTSVSWFDAEHNVTVQQVLFVKGTSLFVVEANAPPHTNNTDDVRAVAHDADTAAG